MTEPVAKPARHTAEHRSAAEWLDAVSSGACDQAQFFRGVGELLRKAPDAGWELLGLVDQYYRRGKLSAQTFATLKTHLQGLMVGGGNSDAVSAPPRMQDEPPAHVLTESKRPQPVFRGATTPSRDAASATTPSRDPAGRTAADPAGPAPPAAEPRTRALGVGDVLRGRYRVQGLIGQGGMGTVYAAIDQFRLDRSAADQKVALKVLHTEVIKRPRLFAELRREFQHLQSLSHPNIVRVHEFDRDGDLAFFTMEYLSGAMLSRVLSAQESSVLDRPYALAIIRDVGSAVAHAHARGIVHGDLNPGNIFITDHGEVRVLDFGAAHKLHRGPWISEFDDQRTVSVATRGFASCQVLEGEAADARDDVFALACIAYVLLTGDNPFQDHTALQARTRRVVPARPRGLHLRQWQALRAGLQFDRDKRPADAQAWVARLELKGAASALPDLTSLWTVRPRRRRKGLNWATAAVVAALVAAGAWWAGRNGDLVAQAASTAGPFYESLAARAAATGQWLRNLGGNHPEPVIEAPAAPTGPPAADAAPAASLPLARLAAQARTAGNLPSAASESQLPAPRPAPAAATPGRPYASPPVVADALPGNEAPNTAGSAGAGAAGGRARIELAEDTVEVAPGDSVARIVVKRSRNMRGDVSFSWWTESGTAKAGRDFVPVKAQVEHIDSGQPTLGLMVPIVVDSGRRATRNFYVVIDAPSDNAALGTHTLTMVSLPGSDVRPEALEGDPTAGQ